MTAAPCLAPSDGPLDLALATCADATPALLATRSLLRRSDTKFTPPIARIPELVAALAGDYAVVRLPRALARYRSLYFDTPDLRCFHDHRCGRRIRHKVRIRQYPDRGLGFLELKTRRSEHVTEKHRIAIAHDQEQLAGAEHAFLREHVGFADALAPQLWIDYHRITLVGLATEERVTIDLDLEIAPLGGAYHPLGGFAVVEVKQVALDTRTPVMRVLAAAGLRETSSSKYSVAVARLRPDVRMNRLLPTLRTLERLS